MYIGKYYHKLEEKGRVSLPKAFRSTHQKWVVTRGLDGGLAVYDEPQFENMLAELQSVSFTKKKQRDLIRLMTNEAQAVEADASGRVQLPDYLINLAGLTKDLVIVGSHNHVEIWDQAQYHQYIDTLEPQMESLAETYDN